jgi:indolepyruvate ferredoxin oxidoreductase, alpha subunit
MAERSFEREVQDLRLGEGEVFRGEGILAITKALLQSGVAYVAGYQGSPISHLMDVLADARDVMDELGVHFETSASEATAAATLSASVMYPLRGAVTWKSTAGTNVAADALSNLSSGGVTGGALIIIGEDYGEGSSIMQERSHAFAMKSQMWLLDPRPNLPMLVRMVEEGFELSEATNTPVMLEVRIRTCHVHGQFIAKNNKRPTFALRWRIRLATSIASCCRRPRSCMRRRNWKSVGRQPSILSRRGASTSSSDPAKAMSASSCWAGSTTR